MLIEIIIWFIIGFFVVRYTDNGAISMISYNNPYLALLILFLSWLLWPLQLIIRIKEYYEK